MNTETAREAAYVPRIMPTDLDELSALARQWGASDAVALEAGQVRLDPRVRFKCMVPNCYMSGGCAHCPPHGFSLETVEKAVLAHEAGVFFRVKTPPPMVASQGLSQCIQSGVMDDSGWLLNLGAHYILVMSIARLLQKTAREMGYASGAAFAAGNCRDALCHFQPVCRRMSGQACRNPELSAPSMESCGLDVFAMAAGAGWDVYPVGGTADAATVGTGSLMGLTLLAADPRPGYGALEEEDGAAPRAKKQAHPGAWEALREAGRSLGRTWGAWRQDNVTPGQMPRLVQNRGVWLRLYHNMALLTGSRPRAAAAMARLMAGRPHKK